MVAATAMRGRGAPGSRMAPTHPALQASTPEHRHRHLDRHGEGGTVASTSTPSTSPSRRTVARQRREGRIDASRVSAARRAAAAASAADCSDKRADSSGRRRPPSLPTSRRPSGDTAPSGDTVPDMPSTPVTTETSPAFDVEALRAQFPALQGGAAHFDGPGRLADPAGRGRRDRPPAHPADVDPRRGDRRRSATPTRPCSLRGQRSAT